MYCKCRQPTAQGKGAEASESINKVMGGFTSSPAADVDLHRSGAERKRFQSNTAAESACSTADLPHRCFFGSAGGCVSLIGFRRVGLFRMRARSATRVGRVGSAPPHPACLLRPGEEGHCSWGEVGQPASCGTWTCGCRPLGSGSPSMGPAVLTLASQSGAVILQRPAAPQPGAVAGAPMRPMERVGGWRRVCGGDR